MVKRNTGKPAEKDFQDTWARQGKAAYLFRLADAAEIYGRTKGKMTVRSQPSDYILVTEGRTIFAEVKSSEDPTAFRFSLLKTSQTGPAQMVLAAGGEYEIFVQSIANHTWYRFPYAVVKAVREIGKASIPWSDLKDFEWTSPTSWPTSPATRGSTRSLRTAGFGVTRSRGVPTVSG